MVIKKLMAMVVLAVFLVSMIPAALAQDDAISISSDLSNSADDTEDIDDNEVTEPEIERFIRDKVRIGTSMDVCAKRVFEVFPDVDEKRAEILCERFMGKPIAISARPKLISAENTVVKSVAVRRIQEMNKEQFREEKEFLLEKAIEKCDETDDPEACE
ncbi:MAG: hypothetical protein KAS15_06210, partial [Nanoarchaeota archaeon]|nr:hypothetical protein [Nanoarchaeota archaeon]